MRIRRQILQKLRQHLNRKEITLITGPRQAGKTTLLKELIRKAQQEGKKTLFLDLDFEEDKYHFQSQRALINKIQLEFGEQFGIVFIDEIQRKKDAGVFLKGIFDRDLPVKFVVSGSGSLELKEKIHESLFGRKQIFEVQTLSFAESVDFSTDYKYTDRLIEFITLQPDQYHQLLENYLNYGGYPKVALESSHIERSNQIKEIYTSYLTRDIIGLLNIERPDAYSRLIRFLAAHAGRFTDFSTMARESGISVPTVKKYLWFAEKTYIIKVVTPYYTNKIKEITKTALYYFTDLGFRNYSIGEFGTANLKSDSGFVFQNMVFIELFRRVNDQGYSLHYWRTTDGAEVDFIIDTSSTVIPVEVKFSKLKQPTVTRSLRSFIDKYKPSEAWVVSPNFQQEIEIGACTVRFMPFYTIIMDI